MPHDRNGVELHVDDYVYIVCKVTAVQPTHEYCNVNLETVEPMFPGTYKSTLTLNARQVVLAKLPNE
jgi:hypothetical protein